MSQQIKKLPFVRRTQNGFTLLEILIALFIFTIVSIIMVTAMHTVFTTQSATEKQAGRLAKLQIALLFVSRDLEQTINRPITNTTGKKEGLIGTRNTLTFTHAGVANPQGKMLRTTLQRTRYRLEKESLIRDTWPTLDQVNKSIPNSRVLLTDVTELYFEYLDDKNHFQKFWPPSDSSQSVMLKAIRVSLTLKNWGKISQFYLIPGQLLENKPN